MGQPARQHFPSNFGKLSVELTGAERLERIAADAAFEDPHEGCDHQWTEHEDVDGLICTSCGGYTDEA